VNCHANLPDEKPTTCARCGDVSTMTVCRACIDEAFVEVSDGWDDSPTNLSQEDDRDPLLVFAWVFVAVCVLIGAGCVVWAWMRGAS
jgi:hypothetical protein